MQENGDFRSDECVKLLQQSDIIVTNPPFSLFREYLAQIMEHKKDFIIIANKNSITYKEVFKLIKENKIWIGFTPMGKDLLFRASESLKELFLKTKKAGSGYIIEDNQVKLRSPAIWLTNLEHKKRHTKLILTKHYNSEDYPHYDNYDAINVDKTKDIPLDYDGIMGVPISFLDKYNPEQFCLLGIMNTGEINEGIRYKNTPHGRPIINGVEKYLRILIQKRKDTQ